MNGPLPIGFSANCCWDSLETTAFRYNQVVRFAQNIGQQRQRIGQCEADCVVIQDLDAGNIRRFSFDVGIGPDEDIIVLLGVGDRLELGAQDA